MHKNGLFLFAVLAVLFLECSCEIQYALHFPLNGVEKRCFFEDVQAGDEVFTEFTILDGSRIIEFEITNPRGDIVFKNPGFEKKPQRKIYFHASYKGLYKFCISNTHGKKSLSFNVQHHVPHQSTDEEDEAHANFAKDQKRRKALQWIESLENSLDHIYQGLTEIVDDQYYLAARERRQREMSSATHSTLTFVSLLQLTSTALFAAAQLWYLQSLFKTRAQRGV